MKKWLLTLICFSAFIAVFTMSSKVFASDNTYSGKCGDNLTWELDEETGHLLIKGTGEMYDYDWDEGSPWYQYRYLVKDIVISEGVTSTGLCAFKGCYNAVSIRIPNSLTSMVQNSFDGCSQLSRVHISDLSAWMNIDFGGIIYNPVYLAGNLYLNDNLITELIIPDGITEIKDYTFCGLTSLTSVKMPDSLVNIGESSFNECTGLTTIVIPDSVTTISDGAFSGCERLTEVTLSNNLTTLSSGIFHNCRALKSISIPNGIKTIGSFSFAGCGLVSLTIPDGVAEIGSSAFYMCSSLISVEISNSVTTIHSAAFSKCSSLTEIEIPNSVTVMWDEIFRDCSNLASVVMPNNITFIGNATFNGCSALTSLDIPNTVTRIGEFAFCGCNSLEAIEIPYSVTSIWEGAFQECSALTSIHMPNSITNIKDQLFKDCSNLTSIVISNTISSIGWASFYNCNRLTDVYYTGSESEWTNINIDDLNEPLYAAQIHYDYAIACAHSTSTSDITPATTDEDGNIIITCTKCGEILSNMDIKKISTVKLSSTSYTYDGKAKSPTVVVKDSEGTSLVKGVDYTLVVPNGRNNAGSYTYTVKFIGNYSGTENLKFTIKPANKVSAKLSTTNYTYNGKMQVPSVVLKDSTGKPISSKYYTVSYASGRKNVGKYKVIIKFQGNYSGTKNLYFTINPAKTSVAKLTAAKKSLKVVLKKNSSQVTGYEIQYSTSNKFKSTKTKTLKSYKTISTTLKSLSAKKTYYVRVRTYKTVKDVKYYSGWSTVKKCKTK